MNIFIARQPIFDKDMKVHAYELLYRSNDASEAFITDGDLATRKLIINTTILLGLDKITRGKKAFINFTKETIKSDLPKLFNTEDLVVEILEDVVPDNEFIVKCKELKKIGYELALDDFVLDYKYDEITDLVDVIKVDFMLTEKNERVEIIKKHRRGNIKFLAEKIETFEEYKESVEMGYDYFQGYFFSKPIIISGNDVKNFSATYAMIFEELTSSEPCYSRLESIVQKDVAVSYKLLRLINSPAFYSRREIVSIKQALVRLGFNEMKKWISLLMIRDIGNDIPDEVIRLSLIRGKLCESICKDTHIKSRNSEAFLLGMFSMIDIILNRRLDEVVDKLPLTSDIKNALNGDENIFSNILCIAKDFEQANWSNSTKIIEELNLSLDIVYKNYLDSIDWVDTIERSS